MNKWTFMGRLTREPEMRYTDDPEPLAIARFGVAVAKRSTRGGEAADFFEITAFGKLAEFVEKYLTKGVKILAVCRVENNNYTRRDGSKAYGFRFVAEEIEFCESKAAADQRRETSEDGWMNVPDEEGQELPFT